MLQAMFIDFGLAKERGGHCLLRFDDTNPTAEKQEYIDHIEDICSWLGWAPMKVRQLGSNRTGRICIHACLGLTLLAAGWDDAAQGGVPRWPCCIFMPGSAGVGTHISKGCCEGVRFLHYVCLTLARAALALG